MNELERARYYLALAQRHLSSFKITAIRPPREVQEAQNDLLNLDLKLKKIQESK